MSCCLRLDVVVEPGTQALGERRWRPTLPVDRLHIDPISGRSAAEYLSP